MRTWGSGSDEVALGVKAEENGEKQAQVQAWLQGSSTKLNRSLTFILSHLIVERDLQGYN
jgi:hypothetical protein